MTIVTDLVIECIETMPALSFLRHYKQEYQVIWGLMMAPSGILSFISKLRMEILTLSDQTRVIL